MDNQNGIGIDLSFSSQHLKPALLVSLLSVWVLVLVFYYLNGYTKRRYFTIWTAAWLFYALWLTLTFFLQAKPETAWLIMLKQWCISVSAMFLLWGSLRFMGERVRQSLIGLFMVFLLLWSYLGTYFMREHDLEIQFPVFSLIGLASMVSGFSFIKYRRARGFLGAMLLAVGFFSWGLYLIAYPFFQDDERLSAGFLISAVLQVQIAVAMIILVLEQNRYNNQRRASREIRSYKSQNVFLESKVISTEERYRYLFENAGEAIIITSGTDLRIVELNQAGERLLGIARKEASRQSLTAFCQIKARSEKLPQSSRDWFDLICSERPLNVVHKNGSVTPVEAIGAPVDFGGHSGYQFSFRELTDRSRLEQQLRQSEKLSSLGQMISGVAHELNNPLAVVKGYLELILTHHDLPVKTRSDLVKVARESSRAARLVQNFLAFAREQPAHREMVDLNELILGVVELRKFDFSVANVELQLDLDKQLPRTSACPDQIQQLLIIVINNSLQAMEKMPGGKRIKIITAHKEGRILIILEDSGPGVPAEIQPKIFEPFFTTKEVGAGTGLGLSIAHSIMADHLGAIHYQPANLGGAAFVLDFPIVTVKLPEGHSTEAVKIPVPQTLASPSRPEKILVVDDERAIVEMLGEMLSLLGYTPTLCYSPVEALNLLEKNDFNLVLSDIRMPEIDGTRLYRMASEKNLALSQRFVFLTGDTVSAETKAFLQTVGTPHIAKPFHLSSVEEVVTKILGNGKTDGKPHLHSH
jgi:two-component system NtrC family sensor kinase